MYAVICVALLSIRKQSATWPMYSPYYYHFAHARPIWAMLRRTLVNPRARMRSEGLIVVCRSVSRSVDRSIGRSVSLSFGQSVSQSVGLSARFLSNLGCGRYQTWICGYVQRTLGTARVWSVVVKEQCVYGGRLKFTLMCTFLVKAESGGYQTWICG